MKWLKHYHDLRLRSKLMFWFLIISTITILTVGIFSFAESSDSAVKNAIEKKEVILEIIHENAYDLLHSSEMVAISMACDTDVLQSLANAKATDEKLVDFAMSKVIFSTNTISNLGYIVVFGSDGSSYSNVRDQVVVPELEKQNEGLYREVTDSTKGMWGIPIRDSGERKILPYFRRIKDYQSFEVLGTVAIGLEEENLSESYEKYIGASEHIVILNPDGLTVSSDQKEWIGQPVGNYFVSNETFDQDRGSFDGTVNGVLCLSVYRTDERMGYTYISITEKSVVMEVPNLIILMTAGVMLLAIFFAAIASLLVSATIAKPITKLADMMDKADHIDMTHCFSPLYNDEVGRLARSFINMTERLNRSMTHVLEIEEKRRIAEYNALKWQINPHFLYNTLSSIVWLAKKGLIDELIGMVKALSTLFRIGISKTGELISIQEEVEHAQSYLEIQQIRYQDQFKFMIDVDEDLMRLYTVKIVLQPLVENAIYHGVREMKTSGLIRISGRIEEDCVVLRVMDNGGKMDQSEIDSLNEYLNGEETEKGKYGIGVKNVHDRIRYYFKGDYGLAYLNSNGCTVAKIRIPIVETPIESP